MRFGSSEAQVKASFDVSEVDYTELEADAIKLGIEMSVFEGGALLSDSPSEYSSADLFAVLNPEVIFLLTNHPFMGSLRVMFSEDPSSSIYPGPDYGRIHKNMHFCIDKDSTGLSISLKREHYYECDEEIYDYGDVSADEIRAIMEETEKHDDANKVWDVFDVDGRIDEEDIDSFRARFYAFYTRDEMYF